jgi:hypothetical protein
MGKGGDVTKARPDIRYLGASFLKTRRCDDAGTRQTDNRQKAQSVKGTILLPHVYIYIYTFYFVYLNYRASIIDYKSKKKN